MSQARHQSPVKSVWERRIVHQMLKSCCSSYGGVGCFQQLCMLHGRSRQQRHTREADWSYISECAALINFLTAEVELAD